MEEEKPEKFLGKFIYTKKTITFGRKTLQLSNVSKIEMKSFRETTKAVYSISPQRKNQAIKALIAGVLLTLLGSVWEPFALLGVLLVLIGGGIVWYYYDERNRIKDRIRNYHGLFFDCTSGKTEVLWSDEQDFIVKLFDRITNSMNYEQIGSFVANITDKRIEIKDSSNVVVQSTIEAGEVNIGDSTL